MRHSPLDAVHRAAGARMVPFGGWEMPIQYGGVLEEHRGCRDGAVVFDVSHLGTVRVSGPDGLALLQWELTNDLTRIEPGRAQYTHLLDPADGSVLDDIIVWWTGPQEWLVMPNASNTDRVTGAFAADAAERGLQEVSFADVTAQRAVLAVQGPQARDRLRTVGEAFSAVARFGVQACEWQGVPCVVAGTGYTGEDGVEISVGASHAVALWNAVVAAGVQPAGLGARDTLRLEAGLPLHGHELGPGITPLQANLRWVVRFDKGDFRGRAALEVEEAKGLRRLLRGLVVEGRRPPREGCPIFADGVEVGVVTSGNFSPVRGCGIALGFVPPTLALGSAVEIEVRGSRLAATVVKPPFVGPAAA